MLTDGFVFGADCWDDISESGRVVSAAVSPSIGVYLTLDSVLGGLNRKQEWLTQNNNNL